jgi:hypothetical protein
MDPYPGFVVQRINSVEANGYRHKPKRVVPAGASGAPGVIKRVTIMSVDCGVAWNPFMRQFPRENREWTFATESTAAFIAGKSVASADSAVVLFSQSERSAGAMVEMVADIVSAAPAAADGRRIEMLVGGSIMDAAVAVAASFGKGDAGQLFAEFAVPRGRLDAVTVVPHARTPTEEYLSVNGNHEAAPSAAFFIKKSFRDRLFDRIAAAIDMRSSAIKSATDVRESALSELLPSLAGVYSEAIRAVSAAAPKLIILTGAVGEEAEAVAADVAAARDRAIVLTHRETARIRNKIPSECARLRAAIASGSTVVVSGPAPRANDRRAIAECAGARATIAWVTRPSWASNMASHSSPLFSSDLRGVSSVFEDPQGASEPNDVVRIV